MTVVALTVVYPSLISRACAALDEAPAFKDMPDGYLRVLLRIIKKINLKRLDSPILASRSTLAKEAGKSVETVHRTIRWLEERGLIEREQRARPELRGSSSPLVPTKRLLDVLLLSEAARASVNNTHPNKELKIKQEAAEASTNKGSIRSRSAFKKIGKLLLPLDLVWLVEEQGMSGSGVLQLMKIAGQAKQRLSTVVSATRKYLEDLRGRDLYAYLRSLLGKPKDFGYQAKQELLNSVETEESEYLKRKAQALAGRTFQNRDRSLLVKVDDSGCLIEIKDGQRKMRNFNKSFIQAIEDGRLRGVQCESL